MLREAMHLVCISTKEWPKIIDYNRKWYVGISKQNKRKSIGIVKSYGSRWNQPTSLLPADVLWTFYQGSHISVTETPLVVLVPRKQKQGGANRCQRDNR